MKPMQSTDYLADLQRQWLSANFSIPAFCAYETQTTSGVNVVTQASTSNLCNQRLDPINADHISIVKPTSVRDVRYIAFKTAVIQSPGLKEPQKNDLPRLAQLLLSNGEKYLQLEAIIQNDADRDFLLAKFVVGKGYDFSEHMLMSICSPYAERVYEFDESVAVVSTSGLQSDKIVGFTADGDPDFKYHAHYYYEPGCHSPLSYTLDADVGFVIMKNGFTSVRIRIPYGKDKNIDGNDDNNGNLYGSLQSNPGGMEPNAVCMQLTVRGESDALRSCRKLETMTRGVQH